MARRSEPEAETRATAAWRGLWRKPAMYQAARPPLRRIMVIDQALRANRWPTSERLAQELEVTVRTVRRDIAYLRYQLRAPIEFDPVRNGYHYAEPSYRLPFLQLTQGELIALYRAERLLRQLEGTPFEANLRQAIEKLGTMLPDGVSIRLDAMADLLAVLPATRPYYDPEAFCALSTAVVCRRRVEMVYWTADRNETTRRAFDPYDLVVIDDGWYAVGYCHLRQAIRMFAVQRVRSVRDTGATFDRPADFRLDDYMQGSFRAVRGDGDHEVALRFSPDAAGRIAEKQWHPSQTIEHQSDGSLIVRFRLTSLVEVKRWVMFWGGDCEALEPQELRRSILAEYRTMRDLYGTRPLTNPNDRGATALEKSG
jgi:predicted DNA-binding transcriptional regulator YafY